MKRSQYQLLANMNNDINLDLPINNLSFGQVSVAILREFYRRGLTPNVFPLQNQVDISSQVPDKGFEQWLNHCIGKAHREASRNNPSYKLWHINGSLGSYSKSDSRLIVFHELDALTQSEINVLKNQDKVYVTSTYTQSVFKMFGVESEYLPLGFDSHNFRQLEKRPKIDGVTSMSIFGKWEPLRKGHAQMLRAWVKKYGNNPKYRLNLSVTNPFIKAENLNQMIGQALEGRQYYNLNFLLFQNSNAEYNSTLQAGEIALCMGKAEGRDLPCYHATAMGAWPVAMNGHAYKDYLNSDNAILVNPNGKEVAHDGIFFINGHGNQWNQGNVFTFSDDEFVAAMEEAEKRAEKGINVAGLELQKRTYKETVDVLLKDLK